MALEDGNQQQPLPTFTLCRANNAKYTRRVVASDNNSSFKSVYEYNNIKELPDFLSGAAIFGEFRARGKGETSNRETRTIIAPMQT